MPLNSRLPCMSTRNPATSHHKPAALGVTKLQSWWANCTSIGPQGCCPQLWASGHMNWNLSSAVRKLGRLTPAQQSVRAGAAAKTPHSSQTALCPLNSSSAVWGAVHRGRPPQAEKSKCDPWRREWKQACGHQAKPLQLLDSQLIGGSLGVEETQASWQRQVKALAAVRSCETLEAGLTQFELWKCMQPAS
mmetsp:Transcript_38762/g.62574  ORF Transcript_38762/g.62574 Transcript_38762/m.62574 type:complete len:191 (-) Transcript_38762:269-841(-)